MKDVFGLIAAAAIAVTFAAAAHSAEPLSDEQLDVVTAGAADSIEDELLSFSAQHQAANGRTVKVDGTIDLERLRSIDTASLLLQDSAQSNLRSLININAVQSQVNVLVNLNIMIDSHVGELRQLNLTPR